jgi:hypothetical protein
MIMIDHGPSGGVSMINPRLAAQRSRPATTVNSTSPGDDSSKPPAPYETKTPLRVECQVPISIKTKDGNTNNTEALQTCLKIYYLILPATHPKPTLHHRMITFFVLVSLLDVNLEDVTRKNPD